MHPGRGQVQVRLSVPRGRAPDAAQVAAVAQPKHGRCGGRAGMRSGQGRGSTSKSELRLDVSADPMPVFTTRRRWFACGVPSSTYSVVECTPGPRDSLAIEHINPGVLDQLHSKDLTEGGFPIQVGS